MTDKFLLAGDKFMSKFSASGLFTESKERIQKFKQAEDSRTR